MQDFQSRKQIALNVLEQTAKLAATHGWTELGQDLRRESEHLRSGELNVVVCGEAKRGKSSLINALLEEPELCPADAPVATNAITHIRYGEKERIVVHYRDASGAIRMEEIPRSQLTGYVTEEGNTRNQRHVQLVEIWLNNPKLKDGLVLIDTPGVGSLNIEHTAVTYGIIPLADAVLFVGAADELLSQPELDFCKRIGDHAPHILHVLTKCDRVGNSAEVIRDNLFKINSVLGRTANQVRGVAVSSVLKLDWLQTGLQEDLDASGFRGLEQEMWEMLKQRSGILLGHAAGHMLRAIAQLRLPLETERQGLTATSAEELERLDAELQAKVRRGDELSSGSSLWVSDLTTRMSRLQADSTKEIGDQFSALQQAAAEYLKVSDYVSNPAALADILTADCTTAFAAILRKAESQLETIANELTRQTSLDIEAGAATISASIEIRLPSSVEGNKDSLLHKTSQVGRSVLMHSTGLGTAGAIVGGAIGAILGTLGAPIGGTIVGAQAGASLGASVAGLVGSLFGISRGVRDVKQRDEATLRQNLGPITRQQLDAAYRAINNEIINLLAEVRNTMQKNLMLQIQRELKACREAISALDKARKEKQTNVANRLRDLSSALKLLGNLEASAQEVTSPQVASTHA